MCRNRPERESVGVAPAVQEIDWDGLVVAGGNQGTKSLEMENETRKATDPRKEKEGKETPIVKMSKVHLFWRNARKEWVGSLIGLTGKITYNS